MRRFISTLSLAVLCLFCTACGGSKQMEALEAQVSALEDALAQSEEQRVSDAYDFQRQLEKLTANGEQVPPPRETTGFAAALRAGEIHSVLIVGDSISDGNGDSLYTSNQQTRKQGGCREILTDEAGTAYYEAPADGQGWVRYFREYLQEYTDVSVFHNNAIGGKSAKWFNAHKDSLFEQRDRYDAIFVMLGTNDRWDCLNEQEFYTEYSQLLAYLQEKCSYLTVFTPLPGIDTYEPLAEVKMNLDTRQIADTVLQLCSNNGYTCHNLYSGLLSYARSDDRTLDEYFFGGVHPNPFGYRAVWRLIAGELGLNLPIQDVYDSTERLSSVVGIGVNRPEITEQTNLLAQTDNMPVFPEGVSIYATTEAFKGDVPYGGTVVTNRYEGGGSQIFKPFYYSYDFIRYAGTDGVFGPWAVTNRDQYSAEGN